MAIFDKIKQGIDKAGKAAQDVFDEGKLRIDAYRAREQADKAAEASDPLACGARVTHGWLRRYNVCFCCERFHKMRLWGLAKPYRR